jgi:hypothetical protein
MIHTTFLGALILLLAIDFEVQICPLGRAGMVEPT